jgi:hypothetical protein
VLLLSLRRRLILTASAVSVQNVMGVQRPRVLSLPPASLVVQNGGAGQEAIELSASAGLVLDPWQCYIVEESLRERVDGKWACRDVAVICSRQNGKGSILEARELFGLFLGGEMELIHTAHQFKTSADHFKRIRGLIEGTPDLMRELKPRGIRESHGEESITLKSGARLRFVARSINGSGRGFTKIDMLAIDEAYQAGSGALSSLLPTQLASSNAQTWYTSSVFDKGTDTDALKRLRDRGHEGKSQQFGYFEHSAPADADPDDPVARAQANPGLGTRLAFEDLQSLRESMSETDFLVEHMSVWPDSGVASVLDVGKWHDLTGKDDGTDPQAFAVEVSYPDRATAAIGVAGRRGDDLMWVESVESRRGTGWLLERALYLAGKFPTAVFVIDGQGGANFLIQPLEEAGVEVVTAQSRDVGMACALFIDAVADGTLIHGPQPDLDAAVAVAKKRPLGDGAFAFGRKASGADISTLQAVTLAHWAAATRAVAVLNTVW